MKILNERKFKVQESIINDLTEENKQLKEELECVKAELEFEKEFKNKDYDNLKDLLIELNEKKSTYEDLIQKAILAREAYKKQVKEINEIKIKYNKELKTLMKNIKNGI